MAGDQSYYAKHVLTQQECAAHCFARNQSFQFDGACRCEVREVPCARQAATNMRSDGRVPEPCECKDPPVFYGLGSANGTGLDVDEVGVRRVAWVFCADPGVRVREPGTYELCATDEECDGFCDHGVCSEQSGFELYQPHECTVYRIENLLRAQAWIWCFRRGRKLPGARAGMRGQPVVQAGVARGVGVPAEHDSYGGNRNRSELYFANVYPNKAGCARRHL